MMQALRRQHLRADTNGGIKKNNNTEAPLPLKLIHSFTHKVYLTNEDYTNRPHN